MKRYLLYLLPLMLILGEACSTKNDYTPPPAPSGTFNGRFKLLVKKASGIDYDTIKKDTLFTVRLSQPNNYVVTRSTPAVHALSRGAFQYDPITARMNFYDSTYVAGPQIRLIGIYNYAYNIQRLQLTRINAARDSVLFYDLYKISN